MTFEELKLNRQILNALDERGIQEPTEIQQKAIPQILAGHDIIGIAQTGTGKTAAYLLPLLYKVKYPQGVMPRALILAPTRELVIQIHDAITEFGKYTGLRHTALFGGTGITTQIEAVKEGLDIVVATPGRFIDIYRKQVVGVKEIKTLILDEADRMMDMGFMPQIRTILEILPRKRQNLLFSATMPQKVENLSHEFLEFPIKIEITPQSTPVETVEQSLFLVPNLKTKINLLQHLLSEDKIFTKIIVFTRTRHTADNIFKFLKRKTANEVRVIHANKDQNSRLNAMNAFREGEVRILVSTDVAARGIDISDVSHVVNFDVPILYEDYVHRIGRTGRAKASGKAITFANPAEENHIREIEALIRMKIPEKDVPISVKVEQTDFNEQQEIARQIDTFKKRRDPNFQGAFHEKKGKSQQKKANKKHSK